MKKLLLSLTVFAGLSASAQVYYNASTTSEFQTGSVIDLDGDSATWNVLDASTDLGSTVAPAISAMGEVLFSQSWDSIALTPDNVYLTRRINLTGATGTINLTWKAASPDATSSTFFAEYYSVYVFDGLSNAAAAFGAAPLHTGALTAGETVFNLSYPVSSFAGADSLIIAFRHHNCSDMDLLLIDDINVSGTNGINENVISASVYPNPAKDVINFEVAGDIATVEITTLDGKSVISSTDKTVSVADLKTGLYLYTLSTSNGKIAKGNFSKN